MDFQFVCSILSGNLLKIPLCDSLQPFIYQQTTAIDRECVYICMWLLHV